MGKFYTFVDVQVTDEGGQDYEFPECLLHVIVHAMPIREFNVVYHFLMSKRAWVNCKRYIFVSHRYILFNLACFVWKTTNLITCKTIFFGN